MGADRRKCCICGVQSKKKLSKKQLADQWKKSTKYECDFECCFGAAAEGRTGYICSDCRNLVRLQYRNNRDLSFPEVLDSRLVEANTANNSYYHKLNEGYHDDFTLHHFTHDDRDDGASTAGSKVISFAEPCTVIRKSGRPIADITNSLNVNNHNHGNDRIHEADRTSHPPSSSTSRLISSPASKSPTRTVRADSPSNRKRYREESPSRRNLRPRNDLEDSVSVSEVNRPNYYHDSFASLLNIAFANQGPPISFLGFKLPISVVGRILGFLSADDLAQFTMCFLLPSVFNTLNSLDRDITSEKKKLENFKEVPESGPLTQSQKTLLSRLIKNRENDLDDDGCLVIAQTGSGGNQNASTCTESPTQQLCCSKKNEKQKTTTYRKGRKISVNTI